MTDTSKPVGYLDERGEFHRSPQFHFLGLVDESCGSREHIWSGTSLADACEAWKRFVAQGSKDVDLTGWNCGIIADHRLMQRHLTEAAGTFACPICGQETPHQHSAEAVAVHQDTERWTQENHAKAWKKVEERVAALAARYPLRTPLFMHPHGVNASPAPQWEPSEAQISAALEAANHFNTAESRKDMRRALLAAAGIVPPGQEWKWPNGIPGVKTCGGSNGI